MLVQYILLPHTWISVLGEWNEMEWTKSYKEAHNLVSLFEILNAYIIATC